jgi:hypothetical protein
MQFEKLPEGSEFEAKISFDEAEEAETVRAVYREQITEWVKLGNIDSISTHERFMSDYGIDDEYPYVVFKRTSLIMNRLREFHERTDEAIIGIAHSGEIPPYDNFYITERIDLGNRALQLAMKVGEEAMMGDDIRKVRDLPEVNPERNISDS